MGIQETSSSIILRACRPNRSWWPARVGCFGSVNTILWLELAVQRSVRWSRRGQYRQPNLSHSIAAASISGWECQHEWIRAGRRRAQDTPSLRPLPIECLSGSGWLSGPAVGFDKLRLGLAVTEQSVFTQSWGMDRQMPPMLPAHRLLPDLWRSQRKRPNLSAIAQRRQLPVVSRCGR